MSPTWGGAVISAACVDDQGDSQSYASESFQPTTSGHGYWLASRTVIVDGSLLTFGDAYPIVNEALPTGPVFVGMAADPPTGSGLWLVAADGGVFSYGDAAFKGSAFSLRLAKSVVGLAATPDGGGYWLVAADGGVFSYGDAAFHGSAGNIALTKPVVGMASTPDGGGYWLVAADGGVFSYGDAAFHGSAGALKLAKPVVGMAATPDGGGYRLAASDGGVFAYGDAPYYGSAGDSGAAPIPNNVFAIVATPSTVAR